MKQSTNTINKQELLKWCKDLHKSDIEIICAIYELVNGVILEDVSSKEDLSMFVVTNQVCERHLVFKSQIIK